MPKQKKSGILKYLLIIIVIIFFLNIFLGLLKGKENFGERFISETKFLGKNADTEKRFLKLDNATLVSINLPAVDSEGNGVVTTLTVEAIKGSGRTVVDIESLLFWADTQQSIRMARFVAENFTGTNPSKYDLIYSVNANASLIGGPSAGTAITIATVYALRGEEPRNDVMITGTINHDGTMGPVSGILEKAKAAKEGGATLFLVPLLQSKDIAYETKEHCQSFGYTEICTTETIPKKVDLEEEAGIEVVEVSNIREAVEYFRKV